MFGLNENELAVFKKLTTPVKIQDFLDKMPRNCEKNGDTVLSPRRVLREKKMHCIEGALLAATALWLHGRSPLVMDFQATDDDDDHVIALYKINGYWGAISKTNHVGLRWRDPVYRTPRELALSYFHEYLHERTHRKTLLSYSGPINLKKFGIKWITAEKNLFFLAQKINDARHFPVAPRRNLNLVRPADKMERRANRLVEWKKSDPRT
ncbi:MAG TPA: hypothetical protein VMD74_05555 [Candidatus Methylomirabilis sp.]|nr:hypothetical protein [Candidatus Methylomirabilis sp.]